MLGFQDAEDSKYKELRKLVDEIIACGYFDNYPYEEETVPVEEPVAAAPAPPAEPEPEVEKEQVLEEPVQEVSSVI